MNDMVAGRELAEVVAEKIFSLRRVELPEIRERYPHFLHISDTGKQTIWLDANDEMVVCTTCGNMPNFPEDIADAWSVVEKMLEMGYTYEVREADRNQHTVMFYPRGWDGFVEGQSTQNDVSHAICLAALKALAVA